MDIKLFIDTMKAKIKHWVIRTGLPSPEKFLPFQKNLIFKIFITA